MLMIVDRGLETAACDCYRIITAAFDALIPRNPTPSDHLAEPWGTDATADDTQQRDDAALEYRGGAQGLSRIVDAIAPVFTQVYRRYVNCYRRFSIGNRF